jgi:CO dehydrogenase nickel-insertion accessory protein CooC1
MKASVLIAVLVLSVISMGSAAVLLLDAKPVQASAPKVVGVEHAEFRWGEGTEASMKPVKTDDGR